ncbi:MAG: hypothetical protein IH987_13465 [Planctomycetes bacterium]|nr:hypothetical protein [Planctomycetota bacterium]
MCVAGGELIVRHGPLPLFGNRARVKTSLVRHLDYVVTDAGDAIEWKISADLRDGTKLKLLKDHSNTAAGLFIVEQLEDHLNIRDRHLTGVVPR